VAENSIDSGGIHLKSASGLSAEFNSNGSLRRFDHGAISLILFVGNEAEGGPANLYLRRLTDRIEWTPLLGPEGLTCFETDPVSGNLRGFGSWLGIEYCMALEFALDAAAWFWHVTLQNTGSTVETLDLTYAQDLALAPYGAVRMNEFYVSQYIDHTPLAHPKQGWVIASRQNQAADGRYPWCMTGSLREAVSFATDALQFYGYARRAGAPPKGLMGDLPGRRLQHEHSMAVIRDKAIQLRPGQSTTAGFFGRFLGDHPDASSAADLACADEALSLREARPAKLAQRAASKLNRASLFSAAPLVAFDIGDSELHALYQSPWRHEEFDEHGKRLSFFCGEDRHVVLRAKEERVLRPHGHLLRTGMHLTPDESALTSTVWMNGVFHSMVTQGHVSINRFLSTVHSYLGLFRSHGLRVFVEHNGVWRLLDVPSAFEMSPVECRWIYCHEGGTIEVRAAAKNQPQELTLSVETHGAAPLRSLLSGHVALNGDDGSAPGAALWSRAEDIVSVRSASDSDVGRRFPDGAFIIAAESGTRFERVGGDELLFADGRSRNQPFVCILCAPATRVAVRLRATLVDERLQTPLRAPSADRLIPSLRMKVPDSSVCCTRALQLAEFVPWSAHNALVHYLSPRGLEQYSGGGWGTRDVCQGPVETLLALGRTEPIRDLLLRVMRMQNPDGDWPQWFMFFERERNIRPGDSHGDIVFWPLLVLGQYLLASGDARVLEERVPFFDARGPEAGEQATVWDHARRALTLIERRVIPGTSLAAYGHGDWNDSLQPADPAMRERLCSAWTVTLNFQTLVTLARALRSIGRAHDAAPLEARSQAIRLDFQRLLVIDGVLTGYALFDGGGAVRYLLHPRDQLTGVHHSSLAMIHAILEDLLTPAQIRDHLQLIGQHLHASDGVRLFDRPMPYRGGPQHLFQRAESASYFGREIGLMYMHAHLRYAQALAHLGHAQPFFEALCRANPIGIRAIVPTAKLRQANCYYSSSDAAFDDRYQASAEYERINRGAIELEGGWRVYSSGAGITLGLIIRRFLGLGRESGALVIDPVIPASLDGMEVSACVLDRPIKIVYRVEGKGCGVAQVSLNGHDLNFDRDANPHRPGAARIDIQQVQSLLAGEGNQMRIGLN
jgi:cellobiose phosphorylase